jgi:hypothetical protein
VTWWNPRTWGRAALPAPTDLAKAGGKSGLADTPQGPAPKAKAWDLDPSDITHNNGEGYIYEGHPGTLGVDYEMLRAMARISDIGAIIGLRVNQLAEFMVPQESRFSLGYTVRLRDRSKEPTKAERKEIVRLMDWLQTCGDSRIDPEATLEGFARELGRDTLTFDQACFENVRTRGGKLAGFTAVDATTIRRVSPTAKEREIGRRDPERAAFVQIIDHKIRREWAAQDFGFGIRRPRTWIQARGYGYPELEELIQVVTWMVNADLYNSNNFRNGLHTSGVLALVSKMNPSLFRAFRREFYAMLAGANNSKKTPLIQLDPENKEDLKVVNLSMSNKDMEFKEWRADLRKLACAIFLTDAAELGWLYGNEGQSGTLTQAGPADRITASKERGLRPTVRAFQNWLNRKVLVEHAPAYEVYFAGFDAQSEMDALDADLKRLKAFMSPNEIRARYDLSPLGKEGSPERELADLILDPTFINAYQQLKAAAEAPQGSEDRPPPGGPPGDMPGAPEGGEAPPEGGQDTPPDGEPTDDAPPEEFDRLFGKARKMPVRRVSVEVE